MRKRIAGYLRPPGATGWVASSLLAGLLSGQAAEAPVSLRPPAVPLVVSDPYFSIWSPADRLTDTETTHWTLKSQPLRSLLRMDGQVYRVMGAEPADVPALAQTGVQVLPTRTIYRFKGPQVELTLTFLTPSLPFDLDVLARPVTYLTWDVAVTDGGIHQMELYLDGGAELAVNTPDQPIHWDHPSVEGLSVMRVGHPDQPVLQKKGDDLRIDWGYAYLAAPRADHPGMAVGAGEVLRRGFIAEGRLPYLQDADQPRPVRKGFFVMATAWDLGRVGAGGASRWALLAYDDRYAIRYFRSDLRPYWRRGGATAAELLAAAARDHASLAERCRKFDAELMADLERVGGARYALLCALAYRQTFGGNKIAADSSGMPLMFPKENFSNGCIATVDVLFPQAPFFLAFSPALTRAMLVPILDYAASPRWKFAYAPHDLGTYPHATGQVYGGGEETDANQMPVEESGNMLILLAALAQAEGSAALAERHWPVIEKWAGYLVANGLDPENQLCSADMFGHLPRCANLALKAIIGIGGYSQLCAMTGRAEEARKAMATAREFAAKWLVLAKDEGRTRLAYHLPGSWGMKHNLIWDRILGLGLFPDSVGDEEIAWYLKVQNTYGLPVDHRTDTSLIDWAVWSISLARRSGDFEALFAPLFRYADETPSRVPLSDWFVTGTGEQKGFQARPVVGGIFIRMLADPEVRKRWADRSAKVKGDGAPIPIPAGEAAVVPTAQKAPVDWRYTLERPGEGWFRPAFDDSGWKEGSAGFGTQGTPGAVVRTPWSTPDIWIRRSFDLAKVPAGGVDLLIHHDEEADVYINGVLAAEVTGWTTGYEAVEMSADGKAALRAGRNTIAVHCHQTYGGQYVDVGLVEGCREPVETVLTEGNPVLPGYFADPSLFQADGKFWIYSTTDWYGWEAGPFVAWKSEDLVHWSFRGLLFPEVSGQRNWAPSTLVQSNGKYHLFFSKQLAIHVGVADSPEGPFRDALGGKPLIPSGFRPTQSIDSEVFVDDDGKAYLYWGGGPTYVVRLRQDLLSLDGDPVRIPTNEKFGYVEGPFPFKRSGRYYITGAANGYHNYHIIYGMGDSPMGPFNFPDTNPITLIDWEEGVWGPGHGSVFHRPGTDEWYLCYLRNFPLQVPPTIPRQVCIDRMEFYGDGAIKPVHLTRKGIAPVGVANIHEANLALGRPATASSSGGGQYGRRGASSAVDGAFTTRWVAASAEPGQWWCVDLGEAREISRCELFLEFPTKTYRYKVECSPDGRAWSLYADHGAEDVFESPKVDRKAAKARYLRVTFGETAPPGTLPAIWEFRVH